MAQSGAQILMATQRVRSAAVGVRMAVVQWHTCLEHHIGALQYNRSLWRAYGHATGAQCCSRGVHGHGAMARLEHHFGASLYKMSLNTFSTLVNRVQSNSSMCVHHSATRGRYGTPQAPHGPRNPSARAMLALGLDYRRTVSPPPLPCRS